MMVGADPGNSASVDEYVCDVRAKGDAVTEMLCTASGIAVSVWVARGGAGWSVSSE
jgi:hypothetical protein